MLFADAESRVFMFITDTEIFTSLGISMVLIIIGIIHDKRKDD